MGKLKIIGALITVKLPEPLVKLLYLGRRERIGPRVMDAKAQAVGRFALAVRPPGQDLTIAQSRIQTNKVVEVFDEPCPPLIRHENLVVDGADGNLDARLYSDQPKTEVCPILVYFHGGGWVQGDLETHDGVCGKIAKLAGCIVVAIDYRLAPEHKFPAAALDAVAAYNWVRNNAESLGGDPNHVGVAGDSAGGNLAAVVCQQTQLYGQRMPDLQVLIYPALDGRMNTDSMKELETAYVLPKARIEFFLDHYTRGKDDILDLRFSAGLNPNLAGQPKALIITGGFDPLRDEGETYATHLQSEGVEVRHLHFQGQIHAFINMRKVIPQGNQCLSDIAGWLRAAW